MWTQGITGNGEQMGGASMCARNGYRKSRITYEEDSEGIVNHGSYPA